MNLSFDDRGNVPTVRVIDVPVEVLRAYNFRDGDERYTDREKAIERARTRVEERGCRQQVRISSPALLEGSPLWLIQDI